MKACPLSIATFAAIPLIASAARAQPLFTEATANLGSPQACAATNEGCYSNFLTMADLDGDGDLDVVFANGGGYYVPGSAAPMTVLFNDGSGHFTDVNATVFGGFTGRLRQVAIGDIDGDGDLDLYAPDSWAMQPDALFVNDGQGAFTDEGPARLPIASRAAGSRFGDVDDDGDLDLVLTDWGTMPFDSPGTAHVYLNDGAGHFTEKAAAVPQDTDAIGTGPIDVDLFDADDDADLDMVLASRSGDSLLFLNDGTGTYTNAPLAPQPGPYVYGPDACDVDGDGDLDLWLDNGAASLKEQLLINDGKGHFTDETAARVTGNPGADDNEVQCVDIDGDGDLDAVIASLSDVERVLINDGTGHFALEAGDFPAVSDSTLGLDLGDVDGDGRVDAVTAQGESGAFLNRLYLGVAPLPVDAEPPRFRWIEQPAAQPSMAIFPFHFAVVDRETTDVGPRLSSARVDLDDGKGSVLAVFMGGDLFRAVVPTAGPGTLKLTPCAVDVRGNEACGAPVTVEVVPDNAVSSGAGGASSSSSAAASGGGSAAPGDDGGCGCRASGEASEPPLAALALLALALRCTRRPRR